MKSKLAIAALLTSVFGWGTVPVFLKYFTPYLDAWTVNGLRYLTVVALQLPLIVYFILKGRYSKRIWQLALIPALFNFFQQVLWAFAPYFIDAGRIGFLVKSTVVFSIAGSFILFSDERFLLRSKTFWFGLTLSVAGFTGLSYYGTEISLSGSFLGAILVLTSSLFMSLYGLAVKRYFQGTNPLVSFSVIALYTGVGIIFMMLLMGNTAQIIHVPWKILILVLISGLIGINLAHVMFYVALRHLGVMISYSVSLLTAFLTALLSWIFLGSGLSAFQWATGTLIVLGGYWIIRARNTQPQS